MTLGNSIITAKTYDSRNHLNSLNIGTLKQLSYTKDSGGNITAITDILDATKNKAFVYDNPHRLTQATGQWGTISYAYDPVGNRTYETTDTGNTSYSYNANKLTASTGEKTLNFSYDNNGTTTTENTRQYIYNQNQRLTQVTDTGTVLGEYVYNANGQRVKKIINGQSTIFHYDQEGFLIAESTNTGTVTNEYVYLNGQPLAKIDSIGNKVSGFGINQSVQRFRAIMRLNIDESNLTKSWLNYHYLRTRLFLRSTLITGLSIDGNTATVTGTGIVSMPGRSKKHSFTGNFTATITDGNPDSMGLEIRKPDGNLYFKDPAEGGTRALIRGNFTIGSNVYYYHNDHLGTPMLMTNATGIKVWEIETKPFGEHLSITGSITNNLRFPGQYYDSETGLNQNYFRDYKPEIGRYVEADPIGIQKGNNHLFVYTKNNPLNFIDQLGLKFCCDAQLPSSPIKEISLTCFAEASNNCDQGENEKRAITDCVYNRAMKNKKYWCGSNPLDVVKCPGQFLGYGSSQYKKAENPKNLNKKECEKLKSCMSAARASSSGTQYSYTNFNQTNKPGRTSICSHYFWEE